MYLFLVVSHDSIRGCVARSVGRSVARLVGRSVGRLVGRSVGWLVGHTFVKIDENGLLRNLHVVDSVGQGRKRDEEEGGKKKKERRGGRSDEEREKINKAHKANDASS